MWTIHSPQFESDDVNPMLAVSPWAGHRRFAYDLVCAVKPAITVELGTHYGCSLFSLLQADKDNHFGNKYFAIDTWKGEEHSGEYDETVFDTVTLTIEKHFSEQNVTLLRTTFDEALAGIEDHSVNLLHIDGFHSYEATRHDYETWLCKVANNGIVLFHDIAPTCGYGSANFWAEVRTLHPHFEFLDHSFGLGILFPKGAALANVLANHLVPAVLSLYFHQAQHELRHRQYLDAQKQLEERWQVMQNMETMIKERDTAIESQNRFLEERWRVMQNMETMIKERDLYIAELESKLNKCSS